MNKIKLTNSQIKMIQEHENSIGKRIVLKIDKAQYSRLFESTGYPTDYTPQTEKENGKTFKSFDNVDEGFMDAVTSMDPEFLRNLIETFKSFVNDPSQEGLSPFWVKNGITWGDYKLFLVSTGLFTTIVIGGNEMLKLKSKLLNKLPKKAILDAVRKAGRVLYNKFVENRYDMKNGGKVINKEDVFLGDDMEIAEDGGYPAGAEFDSNAPWNQNDRPERERQSANAEFSMIRSFDEYAILQDSRGDKYYIDLANFHYEPNADEDLLMNKINVAIEDGELKVDTEGNYLFKLDVISKITLANKQELLDNTFEDPEMESLLNDLTEMTSTGSVGGSYVTPKIWANSPKDAKFAKTPMIKGGKMVKDNLTELDKVSKERFVAELDMYIYADDIAHAQVEGDVIARLINKKFDAHARITNIVPKKFGALGESVKIETIKQFLDRVGIENLPKPKWKVGQRVNVKVVDDENQSTYNQDMTINKISYFKPPKGEFSYSYKMKEDSDNTIWLEGDILGPSLNESVTDGLTGSVTFDDCTKLDNNTEAQEGGCSVGAVDNVVKVVEGISQGNHEEYRGYVIAIDTTGYAPKNMRFSFFLDDGELYVGSGESMEDCKQQIDTIIAEKNYDEGGLNESLNSSHYKDIIINAYKNRELTLSDFINTLEHYEKLILKDSKLSTTIEAVALKTGRTVNEVREIIQKNKNTKNG